MSKHESDTGSEETLEAPEATNDASIKALVQSLDNPNDEQYAFVEEKLINLGPRAVPYLTAVLNENQPWLRTFRAAEALGQIGDGRASRPLIAMLRHNNSNVRWSAVRALARVGDTRAIFPLRRIAATDRTKTSWGESVASAAQASLDEMTGRSAMLRMSEPIKIALLAALTLFSIWFATDRVQAFRDVVDDPASVAWATEVTPIIPTEVPDVAEEEPTAEEAPADEVTPTPEVDENATPTPTLQPVTVTVASATANVRPNPNTSGAPIAAVTQGTVLEVVSEQSGWYQIQLPDGTGRGWISASIVSAPTGPIPPPTDN